MPETLPKVIALEIDVTLLDQMRFKEFTRKKSGKIAKMCKLTLIHRPDDYGNHYIATQSVTKEERAEKVRLPILGNGKVLVSGDQGKAPSGRGSAPAQQQDGGGDDVPF